MVDWACAHILVAFYSPEAVVQATEDTSIVWMGQLADIDRTTDVAKADARTKNETAAHKHAMILGSSHDYGADDDEHGTCEHASTATPEIVDWPDKRNRTDCAYVFQVMLWYCGTVGWLLYRSCRWQTEFRCSMKQIP